MTQTVFLRLDTLVARASKTGTVLPSIVLTLCSTARNEFAFVNAEDVVGPLIGTVINVQCGVKTAPNAENVLLLTECADNAGEGTASRRIAEWSATTLDNDELREFLGGELSKTGTSEHGPWMEIVVDRDGVVDRFSFPITLKNAFIRPEDAAPNPRDDTSWTWLKSRIAVAGGLISKTVDDTLKKITLAVAVAWGDVSGKPSTFAPSAHTHAISDVTGLQTALDGKAASSLIGANSGIAPLDSGGKVPAANLPSYVDDVIEAANFAALPGTGETSKIYVTLDNGKTYRWSGSAYVALNELPAFASQAEAEAGTDNTKLMTPLRTSEAIAALAGGGGALVRGSGELKGNTTPHGAPTVPSGFINTGLGGGSGTLSIEINGTTFVLTFESSDPSDGSTWVDNSAFSGAGDYATAVENWLNGTLAGWVANVVRSEFYITFDGVSTGSSMYLNVTYTMGGVSTSGYTAGTDDADGYGAVTEVEIIPAATGKTTYPVRVFFVSDGAISGMNVQFYLKREGVYYPLCGEIAAYVSSNELLCGLALTIAPYAVRWVNGLYEGSLVAKLIGTPTDGGTLTGYAICERVAL